MLLLTPGSAVPSSFGSIVRRRKQGFSTSMRTSTRRTLFSIHIRAGCGPVPENKRNNGVYFYGVLALSALLLVTLSANVFGNCLILSLEEILIHCQLGRRGGCRKDAVFLENFRASQSTRLGNFAVQISIPSFDNISMYRSVF